MRMWVQPPVLPPWKIWRCGIASSTRQKVFGKGVIDEMHTLGKLNSGEELEYAYGLHIAKYKGLRIVEHSGGDAGYRTHLVRFPDQRFFRNRLLQTWVPSLPPAGV